MRFVLNSSVTMRWLFGDGSPDDLAYASHIIGLMEAQGAEAAVPSLWHLEVANVIVVQPRPRSALPPRGNLHHTRFVHHRSRSGDRSYSFCFFQIGKLFRTRS